MNFSNRALTLVQMEGESFSANPADKLVVHGSRLPNAPFTTGRYLSQQQQQQLRYKELPHGEDHPHWKKATLFSLASVPLSTSASTALVGDVSVPIRDVFPVQGNPRYIGNQKEIGVPKEIGNPKEIGPIGDLVKKKSFGRRVKEASCNVIQLYQEKKDKHGEVTATDFLKRFHGAFKSSLAVQHHFFLLHLTFENLPQLSSQAEIVKYVKSWLEGMWAAVGSLVDKKLAKNASVAGDAVAAPAVRTFMKTLAKVATASSKGMTNSDFSSQKKKLNSDFSKDGDVQIDHKDTRDMKKAKSVIKNTDPVVLADPPKVLKMAVTSHKKNQALLDKNLKITIYGKAVLDSFYEVLGNWKKFSKFFNDAGAKTEYMNEFVIKCFLLHMNESVKKYPKANLLDPSLKFTPAKNVLEALKGTYPETIETLSQELFASAAVSSFVSDPKVMDPLEKLSEGQVLAACVDQQELAKRLLAAKNKGKTPVVGAKKTNILNI